MRSRVFAIGVAVLMLMLAATQPAWARAGGGSHFSSGGSSGGGGGSWGGSSWSSGGSSYHSGGGSGVPMSWPVITVIIICIILYLAFQYYTNYVQPSYQDSTIAAASGMTDRSTETHAIGALKAADADFDAAAFYNRVSIAFRKIQDAWCAHKLETIRPFISDGVFERFSLQVAEQTDLGVRDQMDNVQVLNVQLDAVDTSTHFDVATLRISASAADYEVSLATGSPVSGKAADSAFVEYWSFIRRRGAKLKSENKLGLIEGNCPNCGAAVEMNQSAVCEHCKALLRSGEYDWVLAEITQESEYHRVTPEAAPGEGDMLAIDPGFNINHLEDRASVIFWRKLMAERLASVDPIRKVATDAYVDGFKAGMDVSRNRQYWGECGVGSVDTRGVVIGEQEHSAVIEIHWSGTRFSMGANGRPVRGAAGAMIRTAYVLTRKASARSNASDAVSSAHCPRCGGPELIETSNACAYCQTVLNDGTYDWVLSSVMGADDPEITQLLAGARATPGGRPIVIPPVQSAPAPASARNMMAWMIKVANADGIISPEELRVLVAVAARRGVGRDMVDRMIRAAAAGTLDTPEPESGDEARQWLHAMALSAMADGTLHPTEEAMLKQAAGALKLGDFDLDQIIRRARMDLFQAASVQLRKNG